MEKEARYASYDGLTIREIWGKEFKRYLIHHRIFKQNIREIWGKEFKRYGLMNKEGKNSAGEEDKNPAESSVRAYTAISETRAIVNNKYVLFLFCYIERTSLI